MEFKIKLEDAQALSNYLQEQPFKEVAGLIQMLLQLKPIEQDNEKPKQD